MKTLTNIEMEEVSGGSISHLISYVVPVIVKAALKAASDVEDMYQDPTRSLPYNRL
jgi:hypothetical protein